MYEMFQVHFAFACHASIVLLVYLWIACLVDQVDVSFTFIVDADIH